MITINPDYSITLQPGTYTATGPTMDWSTGQEVTPSYTFDTAKTFYNIEVGVDVPSDTNDNWYLQDDQRNIWDLGYINFDEGSQGIPNSWSMEPTYSTTLE